MMNSGKKQKQTILIVDDSEMNRSILADMLEDEYEIMEAEDGEVAIQLLQKHALEISVVLLDVVMPKVDGFEVLSVMNQRHWIEDIPVIMISAESGSSQVERAYDLGVTDFITRPFDTFIVRRRVVNTILLYSKQKKLMGLLADQIYEKERQSSMMVDILSHIVEFRNGESGQHIIRVRALTQVLLQQLQRSSSRYPLTQQDIRLISMASALHDVGKIAVDADILNKPGRLTPEEFEVMKTHSAIGAEMLQNLPAYEDEPLVQRAYEICRWHHERYDGRGYPDRLKGEEIPISAQIVSLADVYDALTSERCYKKAYSHQTTVEMILEGQCGSFNPLLLDCLREVAPSLEEELANVSARVYRPEPQLLSQELMGGKDLMVSERSLRLLDHERMKYSFFSDMVEEIQLEYSVEPSLLTLSAWGAKKLGVPEFIMDPQDNPRIQEILGEGTWDKLSQVLRSSDPHHPVITYECPLTLEGQVRWYRLTFLVLWSSEEPPQFTGTIGKCSDIHDSHQKLRELEERASHDPLTGLLNRGTAQEMIESKLERDRPGEGILVILDLDHLKDANDNYGHLFGDRVLQHLSQQLLKSSHADDIVARVGGDEFLLYLENRPDAVEAMEEIFQGVTGDFEGFPIQVSMGVALTKTAGHDYNELFHTADQALYYAKRNGRNQYRFYSDFMKGILSVISPIEYSR